MDVAEIAVRLACAQVAFNGQWNDGVVEEAERIRDKLIEHGHLFGHILESRVLMTDEHVRLDDIDLMDGDARASLIDRANQVEFSSGTRLTLGCRPWGGMTITIATNSEDGSCRGETVKFNGKRWDQISDRTMKDGMLSPNNTGTG